MKPHFHRGLNWIPILGTLVFALLYLYSANLYPGGSQADSDSTGFDWLHNYWCNLMNEQAMNGMVNPARPFAITAMVILCGSLAVFFYQFAEFLTKAKTWKLLIRWGGLLSMFFAALMFSPYHDLMTIISSIFGLLVVAGIIKEIYLSSLLLYKVTGAFCLILLGLNNAIYYSTLGIAWLPLVQKVTLVIVLCWIVGLNFEIRKEIELIGEEAP